jgi:hypothetical protein
MEKIILIEILIKMRKAATGMVYTLLLWKEPGDKAPRFTSLSVWTLMFGQ